MKFYKSLYHVEVVQRPLIWDIAPEMSNFAISAFILNTVRDRCSMKTAKLINITSSTCLKMFSKIGLPVLELWPLKCQFLPIHAFSAIILKFIEDRISILIANLNSMTRSIFLESDYRCWSYSL